MKLLRWLLTKFKIEIEYFVFVKVWFNIIQIQFESVNKQNIDHFTINIQNFYFFFQIIVPGRNSWDEELIDNQPNNYGYFYQIDSNRPDINRSIRNRFLQTYQSGNEEQFVSFKLIVEYFPANLFDQM